MSAHDWLLWRQRLPPHKSGSGSYADGLFSGDEEMEGLTAAAGVAWPLVTDAYEYPSGLFGNDNF
jgi:hypothetical protein